MTHRTDPVIRTGGLSWPLLVALASLVGVLAVMPAGRALSDPDSYWHVAAGQWILDHGTTPRGDPFSHSMPGAPWTTQEWLSELVLLATFRLGGWPAMVLLAALSYAAVLAGMTRFLLRRLEPVHALLFTGLAAGMLLTHLLARPHVLAWPLLALWVATLVESSEARRAPPWWLLALMLLWANLHGSFTLGLALAAGIGADAVFARPAGERLAAARRWGLFVALAVAVSTATPNGVGGLTYTFEVMHQSFALSMIGEWLSPNFHQLQVLEIWLLLMLALAMSGRLSLPVVRLVIVIGLVHLALKHQRNTAILGLVSPFLLAGPMARQWYAGPALGADAEGLDRWFRALAAPAKAATAAVALALALAALVPLLVQRAPLPAPSITPQKAFEAARAAGVRGNVLNEYSFGGYLIAQKVPVFLDGRSDLYGDALLRRNADALLLKDPAALHALLAEYRIGWTMLIPGTPAIVALDAMPGWRRVHADDVAVVHMRVGSP